MLVGYVLMLPKIVAVSTTAILQIQVVRHCKLGSSLNSQQRRKTELYRATVNMICEMLNALRTMRSTILCLVHKCSQPNESANKKAIKC